jgi:outer membrane protein assembly factor BamB
MTTRPTKRFPLTALACSLGLFAACGGGTVEEIAKSVDAAGGQLAPAEIQPGDWPWWRGPSGDGKASVPKGDAPPTQWSESKNIAWKTPVPGRGHGSPCVKGGQIFLVTADEQAEVQSLLAFDRASGKPLWSKEIHRGKFMHRHNKNSHASCTPACDGERLFTVFMVADGIWVTAADLAGNILWQKKAGDFASKHGYGASPILYKSLVIVPGDHTDGAFLAALHRKTGEIVWRISRPNEASFSSPALAQIAGRAQLLLAGNAMTVAYDPETGRERWRAKGPADTTAATMTAIGDLAFSTGGYPQKEILCIRANGEGDVSDSHVVWRTHKNASYVPSPLAHEGRLYIVDDGGVATSYEADTGKIVWQQRLGGKFSASPILAGNHIYIPSETGTTYVFEAADKFKLVAENKLGDAGFASPSICGKEIYLRTGDALYAIERLE